MMTVLKELKDILQFVSSLECWRIAVFWTLSLLISYWQLFAHKLFLLQSDSYPRCSPAQATAVTNPVCVITGATSGLGAAAAYALSREGFYVVLVGRSSQLLSKTMAEIKQRNGDAQLKAFEVDLSSFPSILKFESSLQQWLLDSEMESSVQLLINNAGILATSSRFTSEGYDMMMGTNYVGAFSLTKLLLPLLENSSVPSRIVNVTSFTHRNVFDMQIDKETVAGKRFSKSKQYPCAHIYEFSKLFILLFSYELHRQLGLMNKTQKVSVIAADPGVVKTNIMREVPSFLSGVAFMVIRLLGILQSPENGVNSILDAALAPPDLSGVYFFGGKGRTVDSSAFSYNAKVAKELWTISWKIKFNFSIVLYTIGTHFS